MFSMKYISKSCLKTKYKLFDFDQYYDVVILAVCHYSLKLFLWGNSDFMSEINDIKLWGYLPFVLSTLPIACH